MTAAPTVAQVNAENIRADFGSEKWQAGAEVSAALRDGNSDTLALGLGFRLQRLRSFEDLSAEELAYRSPRKRLFFVANFSFEEENDERSVNQGFAHARYTRFVRPRIGWEAFGQIQFDEFTRLDRRVLLGGGLRAALVETAKRQVYLGAAVMVEQERIDEELVRAKSEPGSLEERLEGEVVRSTNYFTIRWTFDEERVVFLSTTYAQPRVDDVDDFRLLEEATLSVRLSERLGLNVALTIKHDNQPPLGVEKTDVELSNSLTIRF